MDPSVNLILLGIVGILSGVFGALIALRRYKHEKWWELRVHAYKSVIESLSDLTALYEQRNTTWEQSPIESESFRNKSMLAFASIRKHRNMGAFLFSEATEIALIDFIKFETDYDYDYMDDPSDYYGPFSRLSRKCLDKIVACSKKDLAITGRWL